MAGTLSAAIPSAGSSPAILIPCKPQPMTFSFDDLHTHVLNLQTKLSQLGITPHDAVSITLPASYEFIVAFLAITKQRSIAAPLNPAYTQDEFEFYIGDLRPSLLLIPKGSYEQHELAVRAACRYRAAIAECCWNGQEVALNLKEPGTMTSTRVPAIYEAFQDDIALVLHTSGTTGLPKAVPLTHLNLATTMENIKRTYTLSPNDRTLLVMPLFHVHGLLAGLLAPLHSGGSVIAPVRFSVSEFWKHFIDHRATWYTAVPTIHQILLQSPRPAKLPKIRFIRSCSSPLSPKLFHRLEDAFNAPVLEAYAMTEGAHQMTSNPPPPAKRYPGSVGVGMGVEVKILDQNGTEVIQGSEAEICIRGKNVTKGYLNNPAANKSSFTAEGFFRTGDQGKQDENGYIIITGRIKELINKGGEKISPLEIDNAVVQHPAVSEAVCFAIPDEIYGQNVGLAVVVKEGVSLTEDELRQWIATKVTRFKIAKLIFFMKIIPKTATGKIQRKIITDIVSNKQKSIIKL